MPLTIEQLQRGIRYWRGRGTTWPQDFHNACYQYLANIHPNGVFNQEWWVQFLPILSSWHATRPCNHACLTQRAQARFEALSEAWVHAVAPHLGNDIAGVEWNQVFSFPAVVAEIKGTLSPVFSSKLCHFLAPRIFPVVDNAAMGNPFRTYGEYFMVGREEWLDTDEAIQNALIALLTEEIHDALLFDGFPMKCKLIELCMIGRNNER